MKPKKYFLTLLKRFLLLRSLGVFFALVIFVFMAVFPRTTLAWNPYESYLSWFDDYRNYISDSAAKIPENISRVSKKIVRILPEIKNIKTDIKMTANVAGENISANASSFFSLFSNYYNKYTSELAYLFYTPKTVSEFGSVFIIIVGKEREERGSIGGDILSSDIGRHFYICFYIFYLRQDPYYFFGYPRYIFRYLCSRIGNIISVIIEPRQITFIRIPGESGPRKNRHKNKNNQSKKHPQGP